MPSAVPIGTFEQRHKAHDQGNGSCPPLPLQQDPNQAKKPDRGFRPEDQPSDAAGRRGPQLDRDLGRWAALGIWIAACPKIVFATTITITPSDHVQRRVCQPENAHQPDMIANPAAPKLDESKHGFAAASAARPLPLATAHHIDRRTSCLLPPGCRTNSALWVIRTQALNVPSCQLSVLSRRTQTNRYSTGN